MIKQKIEKQYGKMWSKNGDKISMLYSGTKLVMTMCCAARFLMRFVIFVVRALKQDFLRKGHRTLKGFLKDSINSARRYFLNIFKDSKRHRGVNLVVGCGSTSVESARNSTSSVNSSLDRDSFF